MRLAELDIGGGSSETMVAVVLLAVGFDEVAGGARRGGEQQKREHAHGERDPEGDAQPAHSAAPCVKPPSKR